VRTVCAAAIFAIAAAASLGGASWAADPAGPALAAAARAGDHDAAVALIESGADVNEQAADGATALLWASHRGDVDLVERLIAAGADPNIPNEFGALALQEAAAEGDAEIVRLLLAAGADLESKTAEGQTALMAIARTGSIDAARALIDAGAEVNAVESWGGQTALMWAAAQHQPEMIAFLISKGANPNAQATARDWERRVTSEPRIKEMPSGGFTPLLYAARQGCTECARELIKGGADPDLADPDGVTPIIAAALNFRWDVALYLATEGGADVDQWDWYGRTPVFAAVDMATIPTGMRPDLPSMDKTTGQEVVAALLERGADPNYRLKLEPAYRNIAYDRGADTNVLTMGSTPLMRAVVSGDAVSTRLLIEHGADVNLVNGRGLTAAMLAAGVGRSATATRGEFVTQPQIIEVLRQLADAGADLNVRDGRGVSAAHGAAVLGWTDVVRFLAERGARLDVTDAQGRTPLDYATGRGMGVRGADGPSHPDTVQAIEELLTQQRADAPDAASEG
jgi:ankyrin repeat protein